jgi:hypothetical protein
MSMWEASDDADDQQPTQIRCSCHRLIVRAGTAGLELRCPRCKAFLVLRWDDLRMLERRARGTAAADPSQPERAAGT